MIPSGLQAALFAASAVILFLYSLEGFSRELQAIGGERLKAALGRLTRNRWSAFAIGAGATAVIQSSSAVSSLTVALVEAGTLTFTGSLPVFMGAKVGTTVTAWLVSFKLAGLGPLFIVAGVPLGWFPLTGKIFGRGLFYFGFILFTLDLVGQGLMPLQQSEAMTDLLGLADRPFLGVAVGALVTAIIQSSSVTAGLAILLVQQGALPAESAISIVVGANVGSTSTALIASARMGLVARRAALANFLFNLVGLLVFLPFLPWVERTIVGNVSDPGIAVAWAHLSFNVGVSVLFLVILGRLLPRVEGFMMRWERKTRLDAEVGPVDTEV